MRAYRWPTVSGLTPHAAVRHGREDSSIRGKIQVEHSGQPHAACVVSPQQRQRLRIESDAPLLMSLGVLLPGVGALLGDTRADLQHTGGEIDAIPPQRAQFPASRSGDDGKPHTSMPQSGSFQASRTMRGVREPKHGGARAHLGGHAEWLDGDARRSGAAAVK